MKEVILTGLRSMEVRDVPTPELVRPDDVRIRMHVVGVCGSDVHNYLEGGIGETRVDYPFVVGHEGAGVVDAVGSAVTAVKVGDRVAVEPAMPCGSCDQCLCGRWNTCRHMSFASAPGQDPGLLREWIVMPERCCVHVPDGTTLEQAAFGEPLSISIYAVRQSITMLGARVGILGAGPIGLGVLLAAQAAGAGRCYVTEPIAARREQALAAGAAWAGEPDGAVEAVAAAEPLGLDAVFECCGQGDAVNQGMHMLKPGGKLVIVGIPEAMTVPVDFHTMRRNELTVYNVRRQRNCLETALELIANGSVVVDSLITHHVDIDHARDAFELVAEYSDGVVKAMIHLT